MVAGLERKEESSYCWNYTGTTKWVLKVRQLQQRKMREMKRTCQHTRPPSNQSGDFFLLDPFPGVFLLRGKYKALMGHRLGLKQLVVMLTEMRTPWPWQGHVMLLPYLKWKSQAIAPNNYMVLDHYPNSSFTCDFVVLQQEYVYTFVQFFGHSIVYPLITSDRNLQIKANGQMKFIVL